MPGEMKNYIRLKTVFFFFNISGALHKKNPPQPLTVRISPPQVFLGTGLLKICNKFTGEHPCRSVFSIKLQSNFIEIALWRGCSPVNLLHIFRTYFPKNISEGLLRNCQCRRKGLRILNQSRVLLL